MERLGDTVAIKGVGREVTSSFVKRHGDICLYHRNDGPYEVFKVKVKSEEVVFGKEYGEREVYPSNEDFGESAWCFSKYQGALDKFNKLSGL